MSENGVVNIDEAVPRFGEWGPGYLVEAPDVTFGVVKLRPGDAFGNHIHERHTESFLVLEGEGELWLERKDLIRLRAGDIYSCRPGIEHYLRNTGDIGFRAVFIKSPGVSGDKVEVPWVPEEESK